MAQSLRNALPTGDAAFALVLLAVSYPVGHLINFPVYRLLQWKLLAPRARERTVNKCSAAGVYLAERASQELGFRVAANTREDLRELFYYMQTITFSRNIEQFNTHDLFHKSLQRLARGMLFPLLLVAALDLRQNGFSPLSLLILLVILVSIIVCIGLWRHFVQVEENEIARFFLVSTATPEHSHGRWARQPEEG